jgi:hypothetical protein
MLTFFVVLLITHALIKGGSQHKWLALAAVQGVALYAIEATLVGVTAFRLALWGGAGEYAVAVGLGAPVAAWTYALLTRGAKK